MGRWIVIIGLVMTQCADFAAAAPPISGIPLPKPRPVRRPPPAAKAVAAPAAIRAAAKSVAGNARAEAVPREPPEMSPWTARQAALQDRMSDVQAPGAQSGARPSRILLPDARPVKSGRANSDCNGGKRIVSAYYMQGTRTASGQPFDPKGMTAAHRTLPFGTRLTVSNPRTGKSVTVVVNDRGPFVSGVSLDLSLGAAQAIGMRGTGTVCILVTEAAIRAEMTKSATVH